MTDLLEYYEDYGIYFPPKLIDFYKFLIESNIDEPVYIRYGDIFKSGHVIVNYYSQIIKEKSYPSQNAVNEFKSILEYIGNNNIAFWESETTLWKNQPVLRKGTFSSPPLIFSMTWYVEQHPLETVLVDIRGDFFIAITDKDDEDPMIKIQLDLDLLKKKISQHIPFTENGGECSIKYLIELNQTLEGIIDWSQNASSSYAL